VNFKDLESESDGKLTALGYEQRKEIVQGSIAFDKNFDINTDRTELE
jgi:hypothetical protein